MKHGLNIAVLVSPARHPLTGAPLRSVADAAAFELACGLAAPERLTVLCAGAVDARDLRDYLGMGAVAIEVLGAEADDVAPALADRLRGYDLVLCGARSDGAPASGLLPYLLAERMELPLVGDVLEAALSERTLRIRQFLPKGLRRRLEVDLPAVLAVHRSAPQTRQFAYARAQAGSVRNAAGAVPDVDQRGQRGSPHAVPAAPFWQPEMSVRRPRPLKAKVAQSGHSRMQEAIGGDSGARGGHVIKEGGPQQKAQALLDYLRGHGLVDF
jgi:electron transfer flavoprotein beta subunit